MAQNRKDKRLRQFVIKKYVMASSVKHALLMEKKTPVEEVVVDANWLKLKEQERTPAIGFLDSELDSY